jgi:methionyl aminopeptidase
MNSFNSRAPRLKSSEEILRIREAGAVIHDVFDLIEKSNLEGATTFEIDMFIDQYIRSHGGRPSFQTLPGYNNASCICLNDQVVHGIPDKKRVIVSGDIISIDIGVVKMGYFADACRTFGVGQISPEKSELLHVAREALLQGISSLKAGQALSEAGRAISGYTRECGFAVMPEFTGHGVGFSMHEPPVILHYHDPKDKTTVTTGMVLALEPVISQRDIPVFREDDGWTITAYEGVLSAQFEETVAVTDKGVIILT